MSHPLDGLLAVMAQLLDPTRGFPGDRKQDFANIVGLAERLPRALQFSLPNWTGLAGRDVGIRKISLKLAEMADAEQSIPDIYREAAEEVRQLARRARLTDIRGDLLELSARFERLAAYADAAIRLRGARLSSR